MNPNLLCSGCRKRYGVIPGSLCSECGGGAAHREYMRECGINIADEWRGIDPKEYAKSVQDNQATAEEVHG